MGSKRVFLFEAQTHVLLKQWMTVLYANWNKASPIPEMQEN
jgi:hypothetical protein